VIRSIAADGRPDLGGVFRPIERPRVLERLATAAQYRIATIIAPAGFGKSVAVRQFLATVPSSVVYDVPSDATTLIPFIRGFTEALAEALPTLRRSFATALDGTRDSQTIGRDLAAWAATHLRSLDTLVVIDDLHVGEGDPEISRFITTLVERTKKGPRWLFSSRSPLALPVASWLAYGESDLVVDAVDLRFDLDEAKQSARAAHVGVRDEELNAILDLVDGWPAALTFALRTSMRASDLRAVSAGTRTMVYRYLAEQVWHSLDDRIRAFLRTASFLPRLDTKLAVAAGFDDAAAIIEALRERVAFISVLDTGVYKLHDLFREFIQRQVQLDGDEALRTAQIQAGQVLEAVGMPGSALERYIDAGAAQQIERILSTHNFGLLESGHFDIAERAVRSLPSGRALSAPGVLAVRAAIEDAHGRVDQAEKWYVAILAQKPDDLPLLVSVAWRYALLLYQQGRPDALPMLEELFARKDLSDSDRTQLAGTVGMLRALSGDIDRARGAIDEALELAQFTDDELRARTLGRAATVAYFASDEDAVERLSREATRLASECGAFSLAARLYATLSAQHHASGRIPAAAWYASQVATNAEKGGDILARARGLRVLLQLEAERGNEDRVLEVERELSDLSYRGPMVLTSLIWGRSIHLGWRAKFAEAQVVLSSVGERDLSWEQNRSRLALLAVVAAAAGDRKAAGDALVGYEDAVARDAEEQKVFDRGRGFAERFAILGHFLLGRNVVAQRMIRSLRYERDDLTAFDALLNALAMKVPERWEESLRAMRLVGQGGIARFVEQACSALVAPSEPLEPAVLTNVELQVLRAMADGLSNKAIADEQRRTINTVRTHVSSILRKLGCESRGEAVAAARRRELV
jgi:LuxR family maltose regulon positive regulatory protein